MPVATILKAYLEIFPEDESRLKRLQQQVKAYEELNERRNFHGHVTGSGIVLSPDKKRVLLIHHKLFNVWQQPGGHWEAGEATPLAAAKREAIEETGVEIKEVLSVDPRQPLVPLDIDTHLVPARPEKNEPAHHHHDIRYVFVAANDNVTPQESEVNKVAWFTLDDPATARVQRCIDRLKRFGFV
jgi:8-oxo-dGTP pyrophosphatase MutT (NUDIX family)